MIDQLITALSKEVELSAEEIADTIWLALQMQESQSESISSGLPLKKEDERRIDKQESQSDRGTLPESTTSDSEETAATQPPEEQKAGIYPQKQQQTSKTLDLSFKVPDAPSLREPLTLARALKPLMRRIPSGRELVLDEAATIQRIADEGLWILVLRPTVEPWLDLELVVDEAISMQIWRRTIRELERLLKNYGIFRDVRVWGLIADEKEQVQIRRGIGATAKNQPLRSPKELIDPTGRRLVLTVSDCVSPMWRNGGITPVLELWGKQGSMAIVQMLPKWLWKRTALGRASEVRLQGLAPGVFNQKLIAKEVSLWDELDEETGIKVPVFTLEPDKVGTWAQMVSGKGSIWTSGYVFKLDAPVKKETGLFNLVHGDLSAEQRVQAFRVTASPMARKLAGLLASAPVITLPIVRLIRETLLKDSQQVHVAEVFLGGLLKPLFEINADTNPDYVQYEFIEGVRELLVDSVPSKYVLNVVDEVSKYVAKKVGLSLEDFAAVLRNTQQVRDSQIADDVAAFAMVTAQVLRRLGGQYVRLAEELELDYFEFDKNSAANISLVNKTFEHGYALLIGVGECQYKKWSLPVTIKDTQAIYATLIDPELCAYPDNQEHIRVLNNEKATRYGILEALQWLKEKAEADKEATVFIYYSGHGFLDLMKQRYYLVTNDTNTEQLASSSLSAEDFTEGLRQIKAERLLVIIDAAHSGVMATSKAPEEADAKLLDEFDDFQGLAPSEELISALKQEGKVVFTSSRGEQKSWIKDDLMSIYTFHFLEALRGAANEPGDTVVRISNLIKYLSETVPKTAQNLHNVEQTPYFNVDSFDFAIAKLRGGKGLPDVPLLSEKQIDYTQLRKLLTAQNWKEADQETARVMLQASGQEERGWLNEDDMTKIPSTDLQTIDQLWLKYSNGQFGFSVQKQIWLSVGGQPGYYDDEIYKKFCEYVGWYIKDKDDWLKWSEYTFSLDAPQGHLPRQLPSQQKRIRPYLLARNDLKVQLEAFVFQACEISKSSNNNEILENTSSVTNNKRFERFAQINLIKNRYFDKSIRIVGDRGAGKTTFIAALASLSKTKSEMPFQVFPLNQESEWLLDFTSNMMMQGLSLPPTDVNRLEELPFYNFEILLKPSFFIQPISAIRGKNIKMNISFKEYPGELFNDLRNNEKARWYDDYLDDCATVSKVLFLIDGNTRNDKGYRESFIKFSAEIAQRLNNKEVLAHYQIAVVISKCEEPLLWNYRHKAQELMSLKFPETQMAFQKWGQSWRCKVAYFTCSSFGVMGKPPRPNFTFNRTDERGTIGVIADPVQWKPFGLLAPIYWLQTGKIDPRLQQ